MAKFNNSKDLIYRGDVYDALMQRATPLVGGGVATFAVDYHDAVDSVQAIDAKPVVRGEWEIVKRDILGNQLFLCPLCGESIWRYYTPNYCINCGAEMRQRSGDGE
ncbi:MAG: hypothetical protein IKZ82_05825 [Clostridia bacterium]|nr:hypothetical protein [Clostridia bacterium]